MFTLSCDHSFLIELRWFRGRVVCVLDYEAADPGSIRTNYSVLGGYLTGYYYQQYRHRLDNRGGNDTHRAGNKLFHPYQVGTFVDYPR